MNLVQSFFHKVAQNEEPEEIYELIKFPRSRACAEVSLKYAPKTDRLKRRRIYTGMRNYNRIPSEIRHLKPKKFKAKLKKNGLKEAVHPWSSS